MKKSNFIKLVLIATAFSACSNPKTSHDRKVYMRSDTTARYSHARHFGTAALFYYAFRPYGMYSGYGRFNRMGYYSSSINKGSNFGTNAAKGSVSRGGFGSSGAHVSS